MEQTNNKLEINKNKEDLKLYFFTIQQGTVQIDVTEDFRTVLAYNDTGAIDLVRAGRQFVEEAVELHENENATAVEWLRRQTAAGAVSPI